MCVARSCRSSPRGTVSCKSKPHDRASKPRAKQEEAGLADTEFFALKALAKKAVIDRGQLAHVKDEKLLLQNMNHPLILGLFSTFQVCTAIRQSTQDAF